MLFVNFINFINTSLGVANNYRAAARLVCPRRSIPHGPGNSAPRNRESDWAKASESLDP